MVKSMIGWGAAVLTAASASVALAAAFGISTISLGGGNTAVASCDTAFTVGFTTSRGLVTAVTVGAIADPACEGGSLSVTVTNAAGASIAMAGPQTVPTDGDVTDNQMTLATSLQPSASLVAGYAVSIVGP